MEKHLLSKSTFIRGLQCYKSLYLYKNRYFLRDKMSSEQRAKFQRGTDVGVFAQELFPGGIDCKPKSPSQYRKAVEKTAQVIQFNEAEVIYEAAVQYDRVLILLDILVKQNGKWHAYEVKSSLRISEAYMQDAALQYYVLTNSGIEIDKFFLVHLNPDYVFKDELKMDELFRFVDVTSQLIPKQDFIRQHILEGKNAISLQKSPAIDIGLHCNNPYPCEFIGHCWKHVPPKSIFELSQWSEEQKFEMYNAGLVKIVELDPNCALSRTQKIELEAFQQNTIFTDQPKLSEFFAQEKSPLSYLGFLGHRQAIPVWEKYKAFDIIPISMSVRTHGDELSVQYFNANNAESQDQLFFDFLKNNLPSQGSLIIFDGGVLSELLLRMVERNPEMKNYLSGLSQRILDVKLILTNFLYFDPKSGGDLSLRKVVQLIFGSPHKFNLPFYSDTLATNEFLKSYKAKSKEHTDAKLVKDYTAKQTYLIDDLYQFFKSKS